jgi:hypothetical protein
MPIFFRTNNCHILYLCFNILWFKRIFWNQYFVLLKVTFCIFCAIFEKNVNWLQIRIVVIFQFFLQRWNFGAFWVLLRLLDLDLIHHFIAFILIRSRRHYCKLLCVWISNKLFKLINYIPRNFFKIKKIV